MDSHNRNRESNQDFVASEENAIYTLDLSGNLTFLNRKGQQLLGYSSEEARQLNITQLIAPEIAVQLRKQIMSSTRKRFGSVYEIQVIGKDGRRLLLEVSANVVFRKGGQIAIEGIAVPVIRGEKMVSLTPRCLDADFSYQIWFSM